MHAHKCCFWQNPDLLAILLGTQRGVQALKRLTFDDEYRGAEDCMGYTIDSIISMAKL